MIRNISGRAHHSPVCGFLMFGIQIAIEPFNLFLDSVCGYMSLTMILLMR